jgi:hypothetical protein
VIAGPKSLLVFMLEVLPFWRIFFGLRRFNKKLLQQSDWFSIFRAPFP